MSEPTAAEKVVPFVSAQPRSLPLWGEHLFDALPIGLCICDRDGALIRYNERAAMLWGRSPQIGEARQRYCGALRAYTPDGVPLSLDETPMAEVLRTGIPAVDRELTIERPDRTRISVLLNVRPLFSETGELAGAVNCFQDITRRRLAEERVKESEQRLRELLQGLPAAIYTTDAAGSITFYNEAAVELWGCRPEIGTATWCGSWRLFYPDGRPMPHDHCPMAQTLNQRRPIRGAEAVVERPDGTRVTFAPYPTLLHDCSGAVVGAVNMLVDITERKASEERLRLLASEVDHRAKNMLAVIQALVHLTQADSIPEFKEAVDGRISALSRAHTLLSTSRWEGADLRRIVQDELAPYLGGENVRVAIDGPSLSVSPQLAQSLAMVVHELSTNAVKHGAIHQPSGRIELRWWGMPGDRLLFRWTESGCAEAQPPRKKGFGMTIIEGAVCQQLGGTLEMEWRKDGLRCEIEVPLS
ncbi:MAG TPA: HWE histidine kinase domain-containing protein [Alphaproteobacteria bacterium]|nr:HWE histidine kinase domain-containing protein [Alphaproteobacteria bacterium]